MIYRALMIDGFDFCKPEYVAENKTIITLQTNALTVRLNERGTDS